MYVKSVHLLDELIALLRDNGLVDFMARLVFAVRERPHQATLLPGAPSKIIFPPLVTRRTSCAARSRAGLATYLGGPPARKHRRSDTTKPHQLPAPQPLADQRYHW